MKESGMALLGCVSQLCVEANDLLGRTGLSLKGGPSLAVHCLCRPDSQSPPCGFTFWSKRLFISKRAVGYHDQCP